MNTSAWDGVSGEGDRRPGSRSWLDGRVLTCDGYHDSIRWQPGERLEHLFEQRCGWLRRQGQAGHLAVDAAGGSLSYTELNAQANQLARFLIRQGVKPGDRIGLLSDVAVDGYVGMLAVLKAHAAFVPLDASFPADRVAYIASDARVRLILTRSPIAARLESLASHVELMCIDQAGDLIDAERHDPLTADEVPQPPDELAYIIYTSGSTGRPKGVAVGHASICNFVRVAAEAYGITRDDRVYQGLPLALTLIRRDLDIWAPGEHNGTFRGVNPALVTGTAALRAYWSDDSLERGTLAKGERIMAAVTATADSVPGTPIPVRGRGMACGLAFADGDVADKVSVAAFEAGLLAETAGPRGQVVKLLPPLTISDAELDEGLSVLDGAVRAVCCHADWEPSGVSPGTRIPAS